MLIGRRGRRKAAAWWSGAVAAVALLASAGATGASCVLPPGDVAPGWDDAELVIVGVVGRTEDHDRTASVAIDEIWRGPDLPAQVIVHGGFETGEAFTSGDRTFDVGVRYVFDLVRDEDGRLQDNACSLTSPWSAELAALRPAGARPALGGASSVVTAPDGGGPIGIIGAVALVAVVLLAAGFAIRRLDV